MNRRFIYFVFSASLLLISSCGKLDAPSERPERSMYQYLFAISFKDSAGNDLVAPLQGMQWKVREKPDEYTLEIIPSNPRDENANNTALITDSNYPQFTPHRFEGNDNWYLYNLFNAFRVYGPQEYLIYRITCSSIFSDDLEHDVIAYWGEDPIVSSVSMNADLMPECTKVIFNGKEMEVKKVVYPGGPNREWYYYYYVNIVLDK